ncbi:MAG TPA: DNA double-strand break repair nuclease NurA, partial [Bryobacteraceae bacterium]
AALSPPEEDTEQEAVGELTAIAGKRLGIRRQLAEFGALAEMASELSGGAPVVALFDGSLILWTLENEPDAFRTEALETMHRHFDTAQASRVPLVGYVSRPASRDVVNSLRVAHCPHAEANCDRHCPNRSRPRPQFVAPECAGTEGVRDADLFAEILDAGERSAVFGSTSTILDAYKQHRVCFFYLHVGTEIARCEIPQWVAEDPNLLDAAHALCFDQAQKGFGYPIALAEAHEQAIVRNAEKDAFFLLLERMMVSSGQTAAQTQKNVSKRARRI